MKKHTITDELLRELHSEADLRLREKIEKEAPGIVGLEVGKWYKTSNKLFLYVTQVLAENICKGYGFDYDFTKWYGLDDDDVWTLENPVHATDEEVKAALIGEAKKRGFVNGVSFKGFFSGDVWTVLNFTHFEFYNNTLRMWHNKAMSPCFVDESEGYLEIFKNGTWASIVEQPKPSLSEAIAEYQKAHEKFIKILKNE